MSCTGSDEKEQPNSQNKQTQSDKHGRRMRQKHAQDAANTNHIVRIDANKSARRLSVGEHGRIGQNIAGSDEQGRKRHQQPFKEKERHNNFASMQACGKRHKRKQILRLKGRQRQTQTREPGPATHQSQGKKGVSSSQQKRRLAMPDSQISRYRGQHTGNKEPPGRTLEIAGAGHQNVESRGQERCGGQAPEDIGLIVGQRSEGDEQDIEKGDRLIVENFVRHTGGDKMGGPAVLDLGVVNMGGIRGDG